MLPFHPIHQGHVEHPPDVLGQERRRLALPWQMVAERCRTTAISSSPRPLGPSGFPTREVRRRFVIRGEPSAEWKSRAHL